VSSFACSSCRMRWRLKCLGGRVGGSRVVADPFFLRLPHSVGARGHARGLVPSVEERPEPLLLDAALHAPTRPHQTCFHPPALTLLPTPTPSPVSSLLRVRMTRSKDANDSRRRREQRLRNAQRGPPPPPCTCLGPCEHGTMNGPPHPPPPPLVPVYPPGPYLQ